jgi:hypothetical protein
VLAFASPTAGCESLLEGSRVGNRPEALPPGLSVEPVPFRDGRLPTASGDVTSPVGVGAVPELIPGAEEEVPGEPGDLGAAGADTDTVTDA